MAFEAAGDYNHLNLTPEKCTTSCGLAKFKFAALTKGQQCYCANAIDSSKLVGDPRCDEPCPGNLILRCGGADYYSVYEALGSYGVPLELTLPQNQLAFQQFNASFTDFGGATYEVDFGEDISITSQTAVVPYMYHLTGKFVILGQTTTGEYGEPETLLVSKEVCDF